MRESWIAWFVLTIIICILLIFASPEVNLIS